MLCQQPRHLLCQQPRKLQQLQHQLQHLTSQWDRQHPGGAPSAPPQGVVDEIEMSDVAGDVAADVAADVVAFLAADTTDVLAADTTDVLSSAKAASGGDDAYNFWNWG